MEQRKNNKSKALRGWAVFLMVVGVLVLMASIINAIAGDWSAAGYGAALALGIIAVGSIIDGLAVLVQNAEEQIAEREQRKNLPAE